MNSNVKLHEQMHIRPYQERDRESVAALWRTVFPDDPPHNSPEIVIAQKLQVQRELFFVAELENRVVGTVVSGYDGHRGWLYAVAVNPTYHRQGVGAALIRYAENALTKLGCPKINLQVRTTNAAVVAFYRALGYEVEERISMGKRVKSAQHRV